MAADLSNGNELSIDETPKCAQNGIVSKGWNFVVGNLGHPSKHKPSPQLKAQRINKIHIRNTEKWTKVGTLRGIKNVQEDHYLGSDIESLVKVDTLR